MSESPSLRKRTAADYTGRRVALRVLVERPQSADSVTPSGWERSSAVIRRGRGFGATGSSSSVSGSLRRSRASISTDSVFRSRRISSATALSSGSR